MNVSPAKENILKRIRKALTQSTPLPFPASEGMQSVFKPSQQELEIEFGQQFSKLLGKFVYCANENEMRLQLEAIAIHNGWDKIYCRDKDLNSKFPALENRFAGAELATASAAITGCEALVARTGSIVLSSAHHEGRTASVYTPIHVCLAYTNQLVYDIRDALQLIRERYSGNIPSLVSFATGPSRTADIEKTLVVGVHGPREVYVLLVEQD